MCVWGGGGGNETVSLAKVIVLGHLCTVDICPDQFQISAWKPNNQYKLYCLLEICT